MIKSVLKCLLAFFIIFCSCISLFAQSKTITGKVTNQENGQPLAGVTITEKGKTTTVLSKVDGTFSIIVSESRATLSFSFIGFADQEIPIGNSSNLTVTLSTSTPKLDEVVVIGYGTVKRRDLTGSVSSIKAADIVKTPTFNAVEALQGRLPGLDITRSSGAAGSGVNIRLRGNRSINGNNNPLFIIDGFQGGNAADLNPNDIESIDVLKDASATAIYGAQGANGVIIITTKKGVAGKTTVSYNAFYGVNGYTAYPQPRLRDAYVQLRREAYRTSGDWNSPADDYKLFPDATEAAAVAAGQWVNYFDLTNRNGTQQSHTVSVRSGTDKTKIYLGLGYYKEEGMLRRNDYTRYNVRFNIDQTLTKWARVGLQSQLAYFNQNNRTDPLSVIYSTVPLGVPYDSLGRPNLYPLGNANQKVTSPIIDERGDTVAINNTARANILSNAYLEINPFKGLTFRSNFGVTLNFSRNGIFNSANSLAQRNNRQNLATVTDAFTRNFNWDNVLTYNTSFGDHAFTVTAIESYLQNDFDNLSGTGIKQLLGSQQFYNLGATEGTSRSLTSGFVGSNNLSFAGRINYSYKGKYLVTLSERADGVSRLSPGNKWDYFPSAAVAWNISSESFMQRVKAISNLKIRATYGAAGNYGIVEYGTQSGITPSQNIGFGDVQVTQYQFNARIGNPDLKWERSATANLGLDFGLFNNRLTGAIDAYRTITTNLILDRSLPRSTGVTSVYQNVGKTENKGIEVALSSVNVRSKNFNWNTTLTFTKNSEKIKELINGMDIISGVNPEDSSRLIGRPIQSFYTYKKIGIWQLDKASEANNYRFGANRFKPGDIHVQDLNGDSLIDTKDRQYLGSSVPKFVLGLQNNFTYKNFDLGVYLFVRYGQMAKAEFMARYNPSGEGSGPAEFNYWTPENPSNDFPRPVKGGQFINYYAYQALSYIDGSYFKVKTVTFGYTFPRNVSRKIGSSNLRLYATGNNVLTVAKSHYFKNYDPERGGAESGPLSRQYVFGLTADF